MIPYHFAKNSDDDKIEEKNQTDSPQFSIQRGKSSKKAKNLTTPSQILV